MSTRTGCCDHGCEFDPPKGMGTNGGCRCLKDIRPTALRIDVTQKVRALRKQNKYVELDRDNWKAAFEYLMEVIGEGSSKGRPIDLIQKSSWRKLMKLWGVAQDSHYTDESDDDDDN